MPEISDVCWPGDMEVPFGPNRGKRLANLELLTLQQLKRWADGFSRACFEVAREKSLGETIASELSYPPAFRTLDAADD